MSKKKEEKELEKTCDCSSECDCGCNEGKECTCEDETCNCGCGDECTCGDDCDCDDECDCGCECDCDDELENLQKELAEANDRCVRLQAELVNYRKRKDEETSKLLEYANKDIIVDVLPILDNFERAISMDDDNLEDEVSKFLEGMKMVYANLRNTLEKYGVKEIEALGKEFDHNTMESVLVDSVAGKNNDTVLEVLQKGYMLKDRVVRAAMVKVNKID